mmetsp:Transcript_19589/g.53950  ORF Transcript_19589/g.53950 Transcript_19589/m.53950 type:complete len:85 (+) Transcript_19589:2948-3202(+)
MTRKKRRRLFLSSSSLVMIATVILGFVVILLENQRTDCLQQPRDTDASHSFFMCDVMLFVFEELGRLRFLPRVTPHMSFSLQSF